MDIQTITPTFVVADQRDLVAEAIRAAGKLARQEPARGSKELNELFRLGSTPRPPLDGRYAGKLITLDLAPGVTQFARAIADLWMPWQGKAFEPATASGFNIFTRDSLLLTHVYWPTYRALRDDTPNTYGAFTFTTCIAPGLMDPDRNVLKIDYNLAENPRRSIRRVLDELVEVADGLYLGKTNLHMYWGDWKTVAFFTLEQMDAKLRPAFDADAVAHYEAAGWRANYDRNWLYMAFLMVQLLREQFNMTLGQAVRGAYYVARASIAWAPREHNLTVVRRYLEKFYILAKLTTGKTFDPIYVADRELAYWVAHRAASGKEDKSAMIQALAELHAGLFGGSAEAMLPSAVNRAAAASTVDLITSKQSKDVESDYRLVEDYLRVSYRQVNQVIAAG